MATIERPSGQGATDAGFAAATATAVGRCAAAFRRRAAIARAERGLRVLPDAMLRDMGLHRSEIPAVLPFGRVEYGR